MDVIFPFPTVPTHFVSYLQYFCFTRLLSERASVSLPDSVTIESEEERAREQVEIDALDAVGDYEADANGDAGPEDVPHDIVLKTLKVWCTRVSVLVFACVCVCHGVCVPSICVRENLYLHFLNFVTVCVCVQQGRHIVHKFERGWQVGVIKAYDTSSSVDGRLE
jgi:hypothetical protein